MREEWQPRPAPITFEQVTRLAQETLLRDGHHAPTLIINGSARPIILQFDELASMFEGRAQQMFIAGQALARDGSAGHLRSVYFVSEARLSQPHEENCPICRLSRTRSAKKCSSSTGGKSDSSNHAWRSMKWCAMNRATYGKFGSSGCRTMHQRRPTAHC